MNVKKVLFGCAVVVLGELLFLNYYYGPARKKSKSGGYRLLSAGDLPNEGPDLFEKMFPDWEEESSLNSNDTTDGGESANSTELIFPVLSDSDIFVLFLVTSTPESFERRQLIRTTWANTWRSSKKDGKAGKSLYRRRGFPKVTIYCVFLVGISTIDKYNRRIAKEASVLGDIYRTRVEESYRNMIHKVWDAYSWSLKVAPKFVFKADDDIYVNMPRLIHWLKTDENVKENFYAGYVVYKQKIEREEENDWFVNNTDLQQGIYPNYCIGPYYIFSGNLLTGLVHASSRRQKFPVEDAFMGVVMRDNYVTPYNVGNSLFIYDGSHGILALEYAEEKLKHAVCIGERLSSHHIQQLHERYVYIRKRVEGKL